MKKIKLMLCVAVMSVLLTGNVFASDNNANGGLLGFLSGVAGVVYNMIGGGNECRPRDCQTCRPEHRDRDGNCRPQDNP